MFLDDKELGERLRSIKGGITGIIENAKEETNKSWHLVFHFKNAITLLESIANNADSSLSLQAKTTICKLNKSTSRKQLIKALTNIATKIDTELAMKRTISAIDRKLIVPDAITGN